MESVVLKRWRASCGGSSLGAYWFEIGEPLRRSEHHYHSWPFFHKNVPLRTYIRSGSHWKHNLRDCFLAGNSSSRGIVVQYMILINIPHSKKNLCSLRKSGLRIFWNYYLSTLLPDSCQKHNLRCESRVHIIDLISCGIVSPKLFNALITEVTKKSRKMTSTVSGIVPLIGNEALPWA